MPRTVIEYPRAQADLREKTRWLAENRRPAVADNWVAKYESAIAVVRADPHRSPQADEATELGIDLRECLFKQGRAVYRILFVVIADTVRILRVRHAAQDRLTDADL